ncbi:MAG TPA: serine/threonine-protein kinase, partial [Chroococcales cyanobacterium]
MSLDEHTNATDELSLFGNVDPLLGKTMGNRWEITEFLGEGSMSSVYKAQELQTGDIVVLKILHNHLVANAKSLKRFEQRARSTVNLVHPCVARTVDIQLTAEGQVFLVVEYMKGESLEDLLAKTGHLSVEHAIDIFRQACEGLEYAHAQDIIHRDLKPSNIMLLADGAVADEVKLVDFGVAKLLSDESDDVKSSGYITRTREVFGSPMYMSPEQCMGKRLDARSDIYSLGCVMYETLTGKPPFVGKNVLETAYKHMNEAPKSITADSVASRAMTRIESVIFKCLAKDPNERYQSMSQLRSDIDILLRASDVEWNTSALALKKSIKVKRPKEKRQVEAPSFSLSSISLPKLNFTGVSFEVGVFAGACLLLIT